MPPVIGVEVAGDLLSSVRLGRNDNDRSSLVELSPQPIGVESLVGQEHVEFDVLDQGRYADEVVPLPRQENEAGKIAERIDQRDNLGCQAAARPADRLTMSPPRCASALLMDPNNGAVDHEVLAVQSCAGHLSVRSCISQHSRRIHL